MQWGQMKTLFIFSFLILDVFLLFQFIDRQSDETTEVLSTVSETIATELENNDIDVAEDIQNMEVPSVPRIASEGSQFPDEIMSQIKELKEGEEQRVELLRDDSVLKSTILEPEKVTEDDIIDKVKNIVPFGDQYSYWDWNKEKGVALFFQTVNDHTVYFNQGGMLMVRVEDGEITGYVATLLSFPNDPSDEEEAPPEELTSPLNTIKQLYEVGKIVPGDKVTSMKVGYLNRVNLAPGLEDGPQRFAPTWKVVVNDEEKFFVYAIEGAVFDIDKEQFIEDISEAYNFDIASEREKTDNGSQAVGNTDN